MSFAENLKQLRKERKLSQRTWRKIVAAVCAFRKSEGKGIFGEEPTTFLGWYADENDISKEIAEIHDAIVNGVATYTLKYSVRTRKRFLGMKIELE